MTKPNSICWLFFPISLLFLALTGCPTTPEISKAPEGAASEASETVSTKGVKQLKLDDAGTTDAELKKICDENPELVELTLGGTKITDEGLVDLVKLPKLKKIRLSRTAVTDSGMNALAKCERLEDVDLSQTKIGDFGVWELRALPRLKRLNLYLTFVTDSGLDAFGERDHRSARKIVWLNLDKCPITDQGIPKLASLTALEWMHLGGTGLTDAGLKELAKFTQLKEVVVTKTETTAAGIEKLRAALPDCKVRDNVSEKTSEADIAEAVEYRKALKKRAGDESGTPLQSPDTAVGR